MTAHPIHTPPSATVAVPRTVKVTAAVSTSLRQEPTAEQVVVEPPPQSQHVAHEPMGERLPPPSYEDAFAFAFAPSPSPHWRAQSDHHFAVRKQMIGRLQRLHPLLGTNTTMRYAGQSTRIPELVQRLELMLYKAAASLDEYANVCTLERRVHSLVTLLESLPPPSPVAASPSQKRRASHSASSCSIKRRRRSHSVSLEHAAPASRLTSDLSSDLLAHVFAFVDGVDTLQHVALVNRFFHREASALVTTLCIDVGDAIHARALHGRVALVLSACDNLTSLCVTNTRHIGREKNVFARACHGATGTPTGTGDSHQTAAIVTPPPSFAAATDPRVFTGRGFLLELSALWRSSPHRIVFPKLQKLELNAPFDCANEAESTLHCLHAMALNLSRASGSKPLAFDTLVLDTTVLGDRRVARLVALFHAFPLVFMQQLRTLELRNNFVGEAGVAALGHSLAHGDWRRLETLGLKRNILTDGDAYALAVCLAMGEATVLPNLKRLDVRENYIGKPGFEALAISLKAARQGGEGEGERGCKRSVMEIATSHNCMESREAAHLFM